MKKIRCVNTAEGERQGPASYKILSVPFHLPSPPPPPHIIFWGWGVGGWVEGINLAVACLTGHNCPAIMPAEGTSVLKRNCDLIGKRAINVSHLTVLPLDIYGHWTWNGMKWSFWCQIMGRVCSNLATFVCIVFCLCLLACAFSPIVKLVG